MRKDSRPVCVEYVKPCEPIRYTCSCKNTRLMLFDINEFRATWKYIKILLDKRYLLNEYNSFTDTQFLEKGASPVLTSKMGYLQIVHISKGIPVSPVSKGHD